MSMVDDLRSMLIAHGIDPTSYDDGMLESLIFEAKLLVDEPFMFDEVNEDYEPDFCDDVYMTSNYPVVVDDNFSLTVEGHIVVPDRVSSEGLIYLDKKYHGKLQCTYTVGLSDTDIQQYLLPMVVNMIQEKEGLHLSSITEGDVSIGYDNSTGYGARVGQLIEGLKNKYNGRVVFI